MRREAVYGNPDLDRTCTSFIERQNGTLRQWCKEDGSGNVQLLEKVGRIFERHSRCTSPHYNFCRVHGSLRVTPAMKSGLSDHVWGLDELVGAVGERQRYSTAESIRQSAPRIGGLTATEFGSQGRLSGRLPQLQHIRPVHQLR